MSSNVVHLPRLIPATFCYFDRKGIFHKQAGGAIKENWVNLPNTPRQRRSMILECNKGQMPGGIPGRASNFYIRIRGQDNQQQLILPEAM